MKRYLLSPAATADIEGIASFLDEHAPHASETVLREIREALRRIAASPGIGHPRSDLADEPLRIHVVFAYLIVYRPTTPVEVVRVLHGSRDVLRELRRRRPRRRSGGSSDAS